tara:strand:+ start:3877 stop:4053 length:177 start_codon:yes stop_codon:yes gene_type:complete
MKMVGNLVTLSGSDVKVVGIGIDSMSVILSRGRVVRSEAGRSMGEQAIRTWRRWQFVV